MLATRPDVDVISLCIHPLEPGDTPKQFKLARFAFDRRTAHRVTKQLVESLHTHRFYLPFDGFTTAISGRRYSATAFASKWFCTMGEASQSQNAVTSTADIIPVITASK